MTIAEWLAEKGRKQGIVQGMEQGIEQGIEQGEAIGRREEAYKIARNMLSAGLTITLITQLTGLTADDLETQHD